MTPTLAICRQEKVNRKKSLYGIGFIVIFSIVTNLQVFWFYGFHTELDMDLNCNENFYRWSMLMPMMLIRFLIPMILLSVTNFLTIRQVITILRKLDLDHLWYLKKTTWDFGKEGIAPTLGVWTLKVQTSYYCLATSFP